MTLEYFDNNATVFWQRPSILSRWKASPVIINNTLHRCGEQYMMAERACLNVHSVSQHILFTSDPKLLKQLGRSIRGFDSVRQVEENFDIVLTGIYAKFQQNHILKSYLLATGDHILAKVSPSDLVWDTDLRASDPTALSPALSPGNSLLGCALREVRRLLHQQRSASSVSTRPPSRPSVRTAASADDIFEIEHSSPLRETHRRSSPLCRLHTSPKTVRASSAGV